MTQVLAAAMPNSLNQPLVDTLEDFKVGVDNLLAKRSYFISQVLPKLKEGQDYYEIKGKKSLAKGGAEKLASIFSLTATFRRDDETMSAFSSVENVIAYVCDLYRDNQIVGQGRGAASLSKNQGDVNKTLKMAAKSAFCDGIIRSTGLSDIFTQDLETMPKALIYNRSDANTLSKDDNPQLGVEKPLQQEPVTTEHAPIVGQTDDFDFIPATDKQKDYLTHLISQRYFEPNELENHLKCVEEGLSKHEASQLIEELVNPSLC